MSYAIPRHAKPPRSVSKRGRAPSKHRKSQAKPARVRRPALAITAAAAVTVAGGAIASTAIFLPAKPRPLTLEQTVAGNAAAGSDPMTALASALEPSQLSGPLNAAQEAANSHARDVAAAKSAAAAAQRKHRHAVKPPPAAPVYLNPLRAITGLQAQRIDMGADFAGSGPIYAIGDAVVTSATTTAGWPGGGWVTYQLTDGPAAGLVVFVAEDVQPTVTVGEKVTPTTVVANMVNGSAGIETGWAMPDSSSAESQLPAAGGISGGGPFPTAVGVNFDNLLQALGVPAAPNAGQSSFGTLPPNYPTSWSGVR